MENWEYIDDGNYYMVSDLGRVKSVQRIIMRPNGRPYTAKERILKPATDQCGYQRVALSLDKLRTFKVHRLVAQRFVDGDSTLEVNHINGNKQDNRACNLQWVTRAQNQQHAYDNGLQKAKTGQAHHSSKLTDKDIPVIRELFEKGYSSRQIASMYNMEKSVFLDIKNGKSWTHVK
jgi:hypothetical protein